MLMWLLALSAPHKAVPQPCSGARASHGYIPLRKQQLHPEARSSDIEKHTIETHRTARKIPMRVLRLLGY